MGSNRLSKGLILLFLICIFLIPAYWLFVDNNKPIDSIEEGRELTTFPKLEIHDFRVSLDKLVNEGKREALRNYTNRFTKRSFQKKFEVALSDRFLLRINMIKLANWVDRQIIELAYLFVNDPVIPANADSKTLVSRDRTLLMRLPASFDPTLKRTIDKGIEAYLELMELFPEQNFYAFYIQLIQQSKYHPLARYYQNADMGRSIEYFEKNIPEGVELEKLVFTEYDDVKYFYRTDHHWNIRGVCRAYDLIYPMLAKNYPEITPKLNCAQYKVIPGVKFLGSFARETLYPVEPESFEVTTVALPPYTMFIDGKEVENDALEKYLEGDFDRGKYTNHFQGLYGRNEQEPEFYFPGNPPRNLLIIGSSYRKPIAFLLASHYSHTYSLDLRFHKKLRLSDFLASHQVDDILILGEPNVVFLNGAWRIKP